MKHPVLGLLMTLIVLAACGSSEGDKVAQDVSNYLGGTEVSSCEKSGEGMTAATETSPSKQVTRWKCKVEGDPNPECFVDDNGDVWAITTGAC